MKKLLFFIVLLVFVSDFSSAQRWKLKRYRIIAGAGSANYFGDIGGSASNNNWFGIKDLEPEYAKPFYHLGFLYKFYQRWEIKVGLNYGYLKSSDLGSKWESRNLKFRSYVFEPNIQTNYIFYRQGKTYGSSTLFNRRGMLNNYSKFNAYVFAGLGSVFFSPSIGSANAVQQRKDQINVKEFNKDKNFSLVAPFGVGLFYIYNGNWEVGLEIGPRMTLTDYLDGFKSKWSDFYDIYYLSMISVKYRVETSREGYPVFNIGR